MIKIRCKKCDITFNPQIQRAIKEESDWKILDVNCLPADILVGDYQFQYRNVFPSGGYSVITIVEKTTQTERLEILKKDNLSYRPTPTKKTHEEFDNKQKEELSKMVENIFNKTIDDIKNIDVDKVMDSIKSKKTHEELAEEYLRDAQFSGMADLPEIVTISFIAGRKSMEGE